MSSCGRCGDAVDSNGDYVVCTSCNYKLHFDCAGVKESTYRAMSKDRKQQWKCQPCRTGVKDVEGTSLPGDVLTVLSDINNKLTDLAFVKDSVKKISDQLDGMSLRVTEHDQLIKDHAEAIANLRGLVEAKHDQMEDLKCRLNVLEQYGRNINIEIHGVKNHENREMSVEEIVIKLASAINVACQASDIATAHWLPRSEGRSDVIIVQFVSRKMRDIWLSKKRVVLTNAMVFANNDRDNIYINENLSPYYKALLWKSKQVAKSKKIKYVWVKGGKIFMKKDEQSYLFKITSEKDLSELNKE